MFQAGEWISLEDELEDQYANGPDINLLTIGACNGLRRHVFKRPYKSTSKRLIFN